MPSCLEACIIVRPRVKIANRNPWYDKMVITPNNGISSVSVLLRAVQIYINFKTVNGFKYKMDYSILIVSICIEKSTRIKGLKTEDVLTKMPKNLAILFWAKNGQKSGTKFKKMAQKKSDWRKWWRKKNKS